MTNEQKTEPKKAKDAEGNETSELAHTVRDGAIAANIWKRQSQTGFPYYEFSLSQQLTRAFQAAKLATGATSSQENEAQLLKVVDLGLQVDFRCGSTRPRQFRRGLGRLSRVGHGKEHGITQLVTPSTASPGR